MSRRTANVAIIECDDEEMERMNPALLKQRSMLVPCTASPSIPDLSEGAEDLIARLDRTMEQSRRLARRVITGEAVRVNKRLIDEQYHHEQQQACQWQNKRFKTGIKEENAEEELALNNRCEKCVMGGLSHQEEGGEGDQHPKRVQQAPVISTAESTTREPSDLLHQQAARSCRMIRLLQKLDGIQNQLLDDILASADDADLRSSDSC